MHDSKTKEIFKVFIPFQEFASATAIAAVHLMCWSAASGVQKANQAW